MSPRSVDREGKRKVILTAAFAVIARKGYHGSTIQDVADEAGIGKGTVYEYFSSKEELFYGILDLFMEEFEAKLTSESIPDGDPVEAILGMVNDTLDNLDEFQSYYPLFLEMFAMLQRGEGREMFERMGGWMDRYAEIFVPFLKEGQKRGTVERAIHPYVMARTLVASLDGVILHHMLFPGDARFRSRQKREFERIVRGSLGVGGRVRPEEAG